MQKRTVTIHYELTKYQANQIKALGRVLWPNQNLHRDEVCRRVLLEGAQVMLEAEIPGNREDLLEEACLPTGGTEQEAMRRG